MVVKTDLEWFRKHWKDRESMTLEEFTIGHLDFMIYQHNQIVFELEKVKKELINSKTQGDNKE